jgi:hypothetical protein
MVILFKTILSSVGICGMPYAFGPVLLVKLGLTDDKMERKDT